MDDVMAVCDLGHQFVWRDFVDDDVVVAQIRQCPEMVAKDDHFGLILECSARVLWLQKGLTKPGRKFILKKSGKMERQLDLFEDGVEETTPLTKLTE